MAKYTANDPDITYLDNGDRVNYNFDLLKFDVDKNQDAHIASQSVSLLTDSNKIGEMFSSPKKFTLALLTLATLFLMISLFIYLVVLFILRMVGGPENEMRVDILKSMLYYFIAALIVIIILYIIINKIVLETTSTGMIANRTV